MIWAWVLAFLSLGVCLPLYLIYKSSLRLPLACCFKSLGTVCPLLIALVAALRLNPQFAFVAAALFLHAVADYTLEFSLPVGCAFFMAGHLLYLLFFVRIVPVSLLHFGCLFVLLALTALAFWRWREAIGKRMPVFAFYAGILCIMCACALGCLSLYTVQGLLIGLGGAIFFLSDFMILRRILFPSVRTLSWVIMITYYIAQLCFGFSCLYF
uniref:YhhN-like protein n=1 Tax=uncultured bacterium Contigcl_30 TaxID=1393670 RepID=W0FRI3_9BACT|nr:hypothetical protein [uncultured bacterium Contigcl_30]